MTKKDDTTQKTSQPQEKPNDTPTSKQVAEEKFILKAADSSLYNRLTTVLLSNVPEISQPETEPRKKKP